MRGNIIKVFYSEEDEAWIATNHEYPYLSGFGDTQEMAIEELKVVMEEVEKWQNEEAKSPAYAGRAALGSPLI